MKSNVGNPILVICFCATIFISCSRQTELEGPWIGCEIRRPLLDWTLTVQDNHFSLIREDFDIWFEGSFRLNSIGTIFAMILVSTLVSCLAVGTGGKKIEQQPTLGQELLDLKKAKDEGAISDQEYNEMKEKLKRTNKNQNMNFDKVD
jgi:hypothetical protein